MSDSYDQILNLMHLYAHRFDDGDFEDFADLFADGSLDVGFGATLNGAQEVLEFIRDRVILYEGSPRTNHLICNPVIQVEDGSAAIAVSYVTVLQKVPGRAIEIIGTARYQDRFAAEAGKWRFR
jgi:3-phenylpropionate/cinnamic acid dioxygenase small subunit